MIKQLDLYDNDPFTGNECELCHQAERRFGPLVVFHLDRDCSNVNAENLAHVCQPCYRQLDLAMPDGIANARTQFAFLINRGLYPDHKITKIGPEQFISPQPRKEMSHD